MDTSVVHVHKKVLAIFSMRGCRDNTKERRNMVPLWQYSGNAGMTTCNKPVDATCVSWVLTYVHAVRKLDVLVKPGII